MIGGSFSVLGLVFSKATRLYDEMICFLVKDRLSTHRISCWVGRSLNYRRYLPKPSTFPLENLLAGVCIHHPLVRVMLSVLPVSEITGFQQCAVDSYSRLTLSPRLVPSGRNVINTMPPEILSQIFLKLLEDDDNDLCHSVRPVVSRACQSDPFLFGQICSYWRSIALHTSEIWSRIFIFEPRKSQIPVVQTWLERAGEHPLDITLREPRGSHDDPLATQHIVSLFVARRKQWRRVYFSIGFQTGLDLALAMQSQPSLDTLESITLSVSRPRRNVNVDRFDHFVDDIWQSIHSCKSLKYLDWRSAYGAALPHHCPWSQLTGITLSSSLSFDKVLQVLNIAPQLEYLRATFMACDTTHSNEIGHTLLPTTHRMLKRFDVTSDHDTGPFLRLLSMPALQELRLYHSIGRSTPRDVASFDGFLQRSQLRSLTVFELHDLHIETDDVLKYLTSSRLQGLSHARLFVRLTDAVVCRLTELGKDARPAVLPCLEVLDINADLLQTTDGSLSYMVASRFRATRQKGNLKTMGVSVRKLGPKDQSIISRMFQEGLSGRKRVGYLDVKYM